MGPKCERAVGTEVRPSRCSRRDEPLGGRWSEWVELAGIDGILSSRGAISRVCWIRC